MSVAGLRRLGVAVWSGALVVLAACGPALETERATPAAADPPVPLALPDLSMMLEPVQQALRERFAALQAIDERTGASSRERAAAYGELGRYLLAAEFLDAAGDSFAHAADLDGEDMRWPYFLAHVGRLQHDPAVAAASFERALRLRPTHVPGLIWLAEMRLALDEPAAARAALERARAVGAPAAVVAYGLGRAALAERRYRQAVEALEAALAERPDATRAHYPLALAYRALGDAAAAERHLALRGEGDLVPDDPLIGALAGLLEGAAAHALRGAQAMDEHRWTDAVGHLRAATEAAPGDAFARLNLGTALYMTGDAEGAMASYREAVRLVPALDRAHVGIGVLLQAGGDDAGAIAAFEAARDAAPANVEARLALADALRRTGRVDGAVVEYTEVLRQRPGSADAAFGLAIGLVRLGRHGEARMRLETAAGVFADDPRFAHALARLLAASPEDAVRDGARAVTLMERLMAGQPTLVMAETMAMALAETGRFDEAVSWQRDAVASAAEAGRDDLVARLRPNLRLYEERRPCRTPWTDDDPVHYPTPAS